MNMDKDTIVVFATITLLIVAFILLFFPPKK